MNDKLIKKDDAPMVQGVGVAGQVMCSLSFMAPKICLKQGCELWVSLEYEGHGVGHCALHWLPILMVELRQSIDKFREELNNGFQGEEERARADEDAG
jgi:hypothetical protein